MISDFTIRLLTAEGALLGWTVTQAESKPQGRPRSTPFYAKGPSVFNVEADGVATQIAVHWHDLDVARLTPLGEPTPVKAGQEVSFAWLEPVWMVNGSGTDIPLPPVTVRNNVSISVPVGAMGARGTAM
jgi:hypothetical protein